MIVFIGDVHQQWSTVEAGIAALARPPSAAVLLGDVQCDRPLDALAAPLLARGVPVFWIFGNHDNDGGPEMWANLTAPSRNPLTRAGALHGRVVDVAGFRVAGLGGTFRPRVWQPPDPPRIRRRAALADDLASEGPDWGADHLTALAHSLGATAIWPEDIEALADQSADILVTHEAPASHPLGSTVLDALARAMGAKLVVHGHHHVNYRATSSDGLQAMGIASAWGVTSEGAVLWPGEHPRPLGQLRGDWSLHP